MIYMMSTHKQFILRFDGMGPVIGSSVLHTRGVSVISN